MRQSVEHNIANEEKGRKEQREDRCVGAWQGMGDPSADAMIERDRFDNHIPTVEAKKSAQIDPKTAQPGHPGNEEPTGDATKRLDNDALNEVEGNEPKDQARHGAAEKDNQIDPKMGKVAARQMDQIREDIRRVRKKQQPRRSESKERPVSHAAVAVAFASQERENEREP